MASNDLLKSLRRAFSDKTEAALNRVLCLAGSPLEEALLWGFILEMEAVVIEEYALFFPSRVPAVSTFHDVPPEVVRGAICGGYFDAYVIPQLHVQAGEKEYCLDFAVSLYRDTREGQPVHVDVEVDGHDFHERTKEQAEHDKERDRLVQAAGWAVARFTGSEVYRDPRACARKAFDLAQAITHRAHRGER